MILLLLLIATGAAYFFLFMSRPAAAPPAMPIATAPDCVTRLKRVILLAFPFSGANPWPVSEESVLRLFSSLPSALLRLREGRRALGHDQGQRL